jgi:hypothetical protein
VKKTLETIFSLSLAAIILVSTGGFRVFTHECYTNERAFSLPFLDPTVYLHENNILCDTHSTNENKCSHCCSEKHEGCCETQSHFVKLELPTIVLNENESSFKDLELIDGEETMILTFSSFRNTFVNSIPHEYDRPPPLKAIDFLIAIQQLKLDMIS